MKLFVSGFWFLVSGLPAMADTSAQAYNPPWASELDWARQEISARPTDASAWLEDLYIPWWQNRVARPIADYSASKLSVGSVRLDSALEADIVTHRTLPGWTVQNSPNAKNLIYNQSGTSRDDWKTRAGQNAYFNFGAHPIEGLSGDIGAEVIGNYDERFWFPLTDERRMYHDDVVAKIVRGELKYDSKPFMIRAFEGVPHFGWLSQNDLFQFLQPQVDVENFRHTSGSLTPRGGEMRATTPLGTFTALGGSEFRWGYGPSAYARYDAPRWGNVEQSIVYRNENIPFGLQDPDERRWAVSYNVSGLYTERVKWHTGLMYQPFRIHDTYQTEDSSNLSDVKTMKRKDAFGFTARTELFPTKGLNLVGLGYTYQGLAAGNKHQVDIDGEKVISHWTFSTAYIYRRPVEGPVPTRFEGTVNNPGAFLKIPRGPDDPFRVAWDNREAHIASLTLVWNPTPGTWFFKNQRNVLEDWNINPDLPATWSAATQYRMTYYPTGTDRLYYWDENRTLFFDPISYSNVGVRPTEHPFSSATGLVRYRRGKLRVIVDASGGEALAGSGIAYTQATNFYKPSTIYVSGGIQAQYDFLKVFFRYGQDVWGPMDYHPQFGWAYHRIYQLGLSAQFLKSFEAGARYIGTRMTDKFVGSDTGAFNEFRFYLTYHFTFEKNFDNKIRSIGRALPQSFPEAKVELGSPSFTPDGSGPERVLTIYPHASAQSGILSWKLFIRDSQGNTVRAWEASGQPRKIVQWDGTSTDGKSLPPGPYRVMLSVVDLYGNEITSPAKSFEIQSLQAAPLPPTTGKPYTLKTTAEGLRVTLSSLVLFDVNKYDLRSGAREGLGQVVELLKAYPKNTLRVTGHTDSTGSAEYNQSLSEKRARAVADYLIQNGQISSTRIKAIGYGKSRPVATNVTEEGRQQNRRVEIDILK